jgi:D-alanine-D-alanine ligase
MRIGITYDLKTDGESADSGLPDDFQEEFDSPATIEAIAGVLRDLGHVVEKLGDGRELLEQLLADPPEFVFNFAEGQGVGRSREARVPAVLEMLGIPYSGSDPLALAATLDKDCAKRLVQSAGVAVPRGFVVQTPESKAQIPPGDFERWTLDLELPPEFPFPVIVKPAWEGSSKGIRGHCVVHRPDDLCGVVMTMARDYDQPILVEEYIQGDEITVGIVGNDPAQTIGMMRIAPNRPSDHFVYGVDVKRDFRRLVRYESPPEIGAAAIEVVTKAALDAYHILACRDVSRVDFRLRNGVPYFLEINPLPGLNPESSDLVILGQLCGWTYPRLIEAILSAALARHVQLSRRGRAASSACQQ